MPNCSRFWPVLIGSFLYACIVPVSILLRMGKSGLHWIWNDPAFGFFMACVFPFAVAVFSCVVRIDLLRKAISTISPLSVAVVIFVAMLVIVGRGVYLDWQDTHRVRQPYMFHDPAKMATLARLHDREINSKDTNQAAQRYRDGIAAAGDLDSRMKWLFLMCNFINVSFGVLVFCYILLLSLDSPINEQTCNHLVFVLAAMSVWFPCRAYSDWYMNVTDMSWLSFYAAAWVLLALLAAGSALLALRMVEGKRSLYRRFAILTAAGAAIVAAIAKWKAEWLSTVATALMNFDVIFLAGFALICVAVLFYVSNSVHQRTA